MGGRALTSASDPKEPLLGPGRCPIQPNLVKHMLQGRARMFQLLMGYL